MILKNLSLATSIITVFLVAVLLLNTPNIFAAQEKSEHSYFYSKGKTTFSSHFSGIFVWTLIKDDKVVFLLQTPERLVAVRAMLTQSEECNDGSTICYDGTIIKVNYEASALKAGDTFKLNIDLAEKTELVSFLSGFFENVDVKIGLSKTKTNLDTTQ